MSDGETWASCACPYHPFPGATGPLPLAQPILLQPEPNPLTSSSGPNRVCDSSASASSLCCVSLSTGRESGKRGFLKAHWESPPPSFPPTTCPEGPLTGQCPQQVDNRDGEFQHQHSGGEHQALQDSTCWTVQGLHRPKALALLQLWAWEGQVSLAGWAGLVCPRHPPPLTASSKARRASWSRSTPSRPFSSSWHSSLSKRSSSLEMVSTSTRRPWKSSVNAPSAGTPSVGTEGLALPGCLQGPGKPWSGQADPRGQESPPKVPGAVRRALTCQEVVEAPHHGETRGQLRPGTFARGTLVAWAGAWEGRAGQCQGRVSEPERAEAFPRLSQPRSPPPTLAAQGREGGWGGPGSAVLCCPLCVYGGCPPSQGAARPPCALRTRGEGLNCPGSVLFPPDTPCWGLSALTCRGWLEGPLLLIREEKDVWQPEGSRQGQACHLDPSIPSPPLLGAPLSSPGPAQSPTQQSTGPQPPASHRTLFSQGPTAAQAGG